MNGHDPGCLRVISKATGKVESVVHQINLAPTGRTQEISEYRRVVTARLTDFELFDEIIVIEEIVVDYWGGEWLKTDP